MKKFFALLTTLLVFGLMIHFSSVPKTKVVIDFDTKDKKEFIRVEPAFVDQTPAPEASASNSADQTTRNPAQTILKSQIRLQPRVDSSKLEFDYPLTAQIHIVKNVYAVPQKSYLPSMGNIISGDGRHHFVHTLKENSERPVVYDSSSKQLHPLSYLIKIPDTTEAMREDLLGQGFKENIYMPQVGLLYLEAQRDNYTDLFESLKSQGYRPEYQLLKRDQVSQ